MQEAQVQKINVTFELPKSHVLITAEQNAEYQELKDNLSYKIGIEEAAKKFGCSIQWFKEHITGDDFFRRKLEKFSRFPDKNGKGAYYFNRKMLYEFFEKYTSEIIKRSEWNGKERVS